MFNLILMFFAYPLFVIMGVGASATVTTARAIKSPRPDLVLKNEVPELVRATKAACQRTYSPEATRHAQVLERMYEGDRS
jgi:hypothetical protein